MPRQIFDRPSPTSILSSARGPDRNTSCTRLKLPKICTISQGIFSMTMPHVVSSSHVFHTTALEIYQIAITRCRVENDCTFHHQDKAKCKQVFLPPLAESVCVKDVILPLSRAPMFAPAASLQQRRSRVKRRKDHNFPTNSAYWEATAFSTNRTRIT